MRLWGGRFVTAPDSIMERFNASIDFDQRLWAADIEGSRAYAVALREAGVLTAQEQERIVTGLEEIGREFATGSFLFQATDEDIHTAVERRLTELIGELAGKLHTGRSRNDQVATDLRYYLLQEITALHTMLRDLQKAVLHKARHHLDVIMPGYTHLQRAQPVRFSHWLMSYFWMFERDAGRLDQLEARVSVLPLGSGALAGNAFSVDRQLLARELGFGAIAENSLDAVSDRDFVAESLFWAALLQTHLSRLAEDLIIWSSSEFGFVELADAYATGSSLMPQKKNPDALELLRGKAGRLLGHLVTILSVLKGLPSAYNKDLQEDKEPLFDALDTLKLALPVATAVVATLIVHGQRMAAALDDTLLATDLADYLVRRGIPFRHSHELVGKVVRAAHDSGQALSALSLETYRDISPAFDSDLYAVFDHERSVDIRNAAGGTSLEALRIQMDRAESLLARPV